MVARGLVSISFHPMVLHGIPRLGWNTMMVTGTLEEVDNYQNLVADYPLTDSSPLVDSEFDRLPNLLGNAICEEQRQFN